MEPGTQRTLRNRISCTGIGLHTGVGVSMTLHPAPPNTGVVFHRSDVKSAVARVPARWDRVHSSMLCTTIANEHGTSVATIEHLMAALAGCAIDNVVVELDGPEVPIMDGSASPFVLLAECAGTVAQDEPRRYLRVLKSVAVEDRSRRIELRPADELCLRFEIDFSSAAIARQSRTLRVTERTFKEDIGRARTFGFADEVSALRARGFARGGSLENAVVVDGDSVVNEGGLRYEDEFVRHKMLDCIGDLYLTGGPVLAEVIGVRSGHSLTHRLLEALFADADAWRYESFAQPRAGRMAAGLAPLGAVAAA